EASRPGARGRAAPLAPHGAVSVAVHALRRRGLGGGRYQPGPHEALGLLAHAVADLPRDRDQVALEAFGPETRIARLRLFDRAARALDVTEHPERIGEQHPAEAEAWVDIDRYLRVCARRGVVLALGVG